ncbi:MAG TPA: Maf family protein [Bacillota bacterium]|nr:Maf family protein [Bacillota bacterium]HPO97092.1 Maf family protein [Bacillota bacterium]
MKEITLASASPRRAELLKQVGLSFRVVPSDVDESLIQHNSPEDLVLQLAKLKAENVAAQIESGYVIGADTVVVLDEEILGKPRGTTEAITMLTMLSGKEHSVYTGLAVIDLPENRVFAEVVETKVKFRELSQKEIEEYVASGEPFDKAGAYGIQGRGAIFVERIDGCYFNVVGLPISKLIVMLQKISNSQVLR